MVAAVLSSGSTLRWTTEERPVCAVTSCSVCGVVFKLVSHPAKKTKDITKTTDRNTLLIVMVLISSLQMFKTLVQPSGQTCVPSQALPERTPGRLCRVPLPGLQSVFVGVSSESVACRLNNNQETIPASIVPAGQREFPYWGSRLAENVHLIAWPCNAPHLF